MNMKKYHTNVITAVCAVFLFLGLWGATPVLAAGPAVVNLLTAGNFSILTKTGITNTGSHTTSITGNIGSSPITAAAMDNVFCTEIAGTIYGVDAAYTGSGAASCFKGNPPSGNKTVVDNAVLDMEAAYTDAAGRAGPDGLNVGAGTLSAGTIFTPGLYKWTTDVSVTGTTTLSGGASDIWIFQISGNLNLSSAGSIATGVHIALTGGAVASNVFWQVGGATGATLGTYSTFNGTILSAKQIILQTGAVLNGKALAQTQATLDANTVASTLMSIITPTTSRSTQRPGSLTVVKTLINDNGGTKTVANFPLFIDGVSISSGSTNEFSNTATHIVTETPDVRYVGVFSGDCDASGRVSVSVNDNKICILTNNDIGTAAAVVPIPPLIDVIKVPNPLALPNGPGEVAYTYTLRNVGTVPIGSITMTGDTCGPITLVSGDNNVDGRLDVSEAWIYRCTTTLSETHTNTVVATGWVNGLSAIDTASATVIVGASSVPPLIHITKVPNPLTLTGGGGMVVYTKRVTNPGTVALSNVSVVDDRCTPVTYIYGDTNGDQKLDTTETWLYTCPSLLTQTTTNTAVATGNANGLTARDFAVATVVVAVAPSLPNTGMQPEGASAGITLFLGMALIVLVSLALVLRKRVR
ncbi:MAG: hypothetical protein UY50_C0024G0023 [Parcubacteria group bacterium GW2011_GWA2_49_9]|nr:MAG: hypothetical protein UY50_C0024G0023 [Parcubacteria group bacterium GW2011_GWA2_49_9]